MKPMKDRTMKNLTRALLAIAALAAVSCGAPPYTARVIDAETGEPIAGAVYLAVWWDEVSGKKAWFEGTSTEMAKFVEGTTGEDGLIEVPGFWTRNPFAKERTLTVYKPGHVMWNQEYVFPDYEKRTDFNAKNREVQMEKWKSRYSYRDHHGLMTNATKGSIRNESYKDGGQLLYMTYMEHEADLFLYEGQDEKE
jgi:hypothetical protein